MGLATYLRVDENSTSDFVYNVGNSDCEVFCGTVLVLFGIVTLIYLAFCAEELFKIRDRCSSRLA